MLRKKDVGVGKLAASQNIQLCKCFIYQWLWWHLIIFIFRLYKSAAQWWLSTCLRLICGLLTQICWNSNLSSWIRSHPLSARWWQLANHQQQITNNTRTVQAKVFLWGPREPGISCGRSFTVLPKCLFAIPTVATLPSDSLFPML